MIRSAKLEEVELPHDGSEGTEKIEIASSDTAPYILYSTPRWNKDVGIVENYYEVFNTKTRVVESRARVNYVTALSILSAICNMWDDLEQAGSIEALDEEQREQVPFNAPSTH